MCPPESSYDFIILRLLQLVGAQAYTKTKAILRRLEQIRFVKPCKTSKGPSSFP